jgi:hypothetical protein
VIEVVQVLNYNAIAQKLKYTYFEYSTQLRGHYWFDLDAIVVVIGLVNPNH